MLTTSPPPSRLANDREVWVESLKTGTTAHSWDGQASGCVARYGLVKDGHPGHVVAAVQAYVHLGVRWCHICFAGGGPR